MTLRICECFQRLQPSGAFRGPLEKLRRTQPAISQAIKRLEQATGERLVDRSSRDGTLTDAGELLLDYANRLLRLEAEATGAVSELRDIKTGRVLIGANEGAVYAVLPIVEAFHRITPASGGSPAPAGASRGAGSVAAERRPWRADFNPAERELSSIVLGT
jgi:DNA-binding transcriptional LysR family regulator